jgi:hypothetical protein
MNNFFESEELIEEFELGDTWSPFTHDSSFFEAHTTNGPIPLSIRGIFEGKSQFEALNCTWDGDFTNIKLSNSSNSLGLNTELTLISKNNSEMIPISPDEGQFYLDTVVLALSRLGWQVTWAPINNLPQLDLKYAIYIVGFPKIIIDVPCFPWVEW